ncbi:MAG: glycosylase [Planctomycetaceae bacterium]|jgi:beta-1,2-mannobiose phosphorylase / 1,2-beta-oligomannan phosphorylase
MICSALRVSLILLIPVGTFTGSGLLLADDRSVVSIEWQGHSDNPLFSGRAGEWDALIRERGWVMKDGDTWKLWYTGYNKERQPLTMKMGYATSPDGIAWKRRSDGPIFDEVWIEDMMVIKQNDRYFMFAEGAGDQPQLLESADGIEWTRTGSLDVRQTDGQPIKPGPHGTPTVYVKDDVWHLFYERYDAGIWLAVSTDRKVWTNVSDAPLITPGPEDYDARMIAMNQIVRIDDHYCAVLHGTGTPAKPRQWCTYFAESDDLRHWTKAARGPVLPVEGNKSSGMLVHDGDAWRLYTMHARIDVWFPRDR